jgi:Outer membrane protein beta-barrel family/Carboxypeptidase regulatory-like domain
MRSFLLFIVCINIHSLGYSQGKVSLIKGIITDSASGEPLEQASVSLIRRADSVVVRQILSGKTGFEFRRVPAGDYLLSVSFIGYRPDTIRMAVNNTGEEYNAGKIQLLKSPGNLVEVVVRSVIPPVIVKNDTLVYNTNSVKTQPNATVEDLLKKLPGMAVDKEGNITLHGQKVEKIYVDGKEFFLNDPKIATQNLTADMVDAIEAFDNQTDRARFTGIKESNTNKAINLRLKKDKKKGLSGNMTARAGNRKIYAGAATATYFKGDRWALGRLSGNYANNLSLKNTGLKQSTDNQALNYRDNMGTKTQLVANYGSNSSRNRFGQLYKRETFLGDSSLLQTRNSLNDNRSVNHGFNLNFTYTIDSFNSIIYSPSAAWQQNETMNSDSSFIISSKNGNSYLSNEGQTMNRVSSHGSNFNNMIAFRRRFRKKGRFFYAVFSRNHQQQTQEGNLYSLLKFYDNTGVMLENKTINQQYDQKNIGNNNGLNISYTEPIKPDQIIDLGYSLNNSSNRSGKQAINYNPLTGKYDLPDTLTTNEFTNSNTQQNFNIGYNFIGKKVQYQLGMSILYSSLKNESNNHNNATIQQRLVNWSPRASVFYHLARQKNLQVQYSGNSTAPTTEMLQPIPDLSNPFLIKLGNPNLKQQFQHRVNINYNESDGKKFNNLSFQLGSDYTMNKIVQSSIISSAGIQKLIHVNVNGVYSVNSDLNYGFALNKTKNGGGSISTSVQYNRDINFVNGEQNIRQGFVWGQSFNLNYHTQDKLYAAVTAAVNYSHSHYSIGANLNTELFSQIYSANITYRMPFSIRVSSDLAFQINGKQGNLPGRTIATLNASVYRNIFRNNKGEIRLSGFDLLNRNTGFSQTTGSNYIETRENTVLQRYFVLSLRYNFRVNIM